MDKRIIDLYDEYTHRPLSRREFLSRLSRLVGGMGAALALVPLLESGPVHAALLSPADTRLAYAGYVFFPGATGDLRGYLARPAAPGRKLPTVIVIHENRGLNAHIQDVTRRLAVEGFVALAPDCLSPLGGTPENEDQARDMIGRLDPAQTLANLRSNIKFLAQHPSGNGKVGAVGFCWGGGQVGELAVGAPELDAGVVYYGRQPKTGIEKIHAPLLLNYAGRDTRINEGIPAFEQALKAARKTYALHVYEQVNHAFNNDSSEARYDATAAKLAWSRTVDFFKRHLA